MNKKTYAEFVEPYIGNASRIKVPLKKIAALKAFADEYKIAKKDEVRYKSDSDAMDKRATTGPLAEAGVEILLDTEFMDLTVGHTRRYTKADLKALGLNCGIKSVTKETCRGQDSFPLIHKNPKRPEIMVLKVADDEVVICGVASIKTMKEFQDDQLVRSRGALLWGKTGFYGFHKLRQFKNLRELRSIIKELESENENQ